MKSIQRMELIGARRKIPRVTESKQRAPTAHPRSFGLERRREGCRVAELVTSSASGSRRHGQTPLGCLL